MTCSFTEGSLWRKWDLHIHSPLSILNNQFPKLESNPNEPDWDSYVTRLEALDFAVLGITDYFSVDGYRRLLRFQQEEGRLPGKLLLPNVELRLNVTSGKQAKRINLHVVFSNDVDADTIETHFLHELHFTSAGNPQGRDEQDKLLLENLGDLGKQLRHENASSFQGMSDIQVGAIVAVVDHCEVSDILQGRRFRDKYFLILAEEGLSDFAWGGQAHHIRKTLTQKADMIFTSNPASILWYLGKKDYESQQDFINEFQSLKPCLHGSDAHSLNELGWPCAKRGKSTHECDKQNPDECELRYCWIKADPTFEGLKQLIYEPEDRVRIQAHDPTPARHNYTFSGIRFSQSSINDELAIRATDISLNRGLVTITGGRGTGKTAFVDLLAHCFLDRINTTDENSFVRRICSQGPDLQTTVCFVDADEFTKPVSGQEFVEETDLSYISQGELNEYIGRNSDLSSRINDLIFDSVTEMHCYSYETLSQTIEEREREILDLSRNTIELEKVTGQPIRNQLAADKKRIEAELRDIERQIQDIEKDTVDSTAVRSAQAVQQRLTTHKQRKAVLQDLKNLIVKAKSFFSNELSRFNEDVETINQYLHEVALETVIAPVVYEEAMLDTLLSKVENEISQTLTALDKEQDELETLQSQVSHHAKLLTEREEKKSEHDQIQQQEDKITELEVNRDKVKKQRAIRYTEMLKAVTAKQERYTQIIEHLTRQLSTSASKADTRDVLKDLEFFAEIHFDQEKFLEIAEDLFDGRSVHVREKDSPFSKVLGLFCNFAHQPDATLDMLATEIEQIAENTSLRDKIKTNKNIDMFDYYRCFYSNYFTITPIVKYKNTKLEHLSLGQKATVLIKIYLAQGRKPIVIDSHDDHLDNQFIMEELIPAVRQAKNFRQIILVSNNANVVVNTDAEQIVVAERNGVEITFVSGSLENPTIRDKTLRVLEGGKEAFKKRQEKYRLT